MDYTLNQDDRKLGKIPQNIPTLSVFVGVRVTCLVAEFQSFVLFSVVSDNNTSSSREITPSAFEGFIQNLFSCSEIMHAKYSGNKVTASD